MVPQAAAALANLRKNYGQKLIYKGRSYACTAEPINQKTADAFLPQGAVNSAEADPWIFSVTESDFTELPTEGETFAYEGLERKLIRPPMKTALSCVLVAYRVPALTTNTNDAAQEDVWPCVTP